MGKYTNIKYLGGHPALAKPCEVNVDVDNSSKVVTIKETGFLNDGVAKIFADSIVSVSFDEKSKRSAGGAVKGALIGGVLTGGIGLLAGAAIGGRRRDDSNLYLTIKFNTREFDVILKAGKYADDLYAEIMSILT